MLPIGAACQCGQPRLQRLPVLGSCLLLVPQEAPNWDQAGGPLTFRSADGCTGAPRHCLHVPAGAPPLQPAAAHAHLSCPPPPLLCCAVLCSMRGVPELQSAVAGMLERFLLPGFAVDPSKLCISAGALLQCVPLALCSTCLAAGLSRLACWLAHIHSLPVGAVLKYTVPLPHCCLAP